MLQARNLTKKYGAITAVDNVSFNVEAGQLVGFIGGNGAGKTTTMRMMMGLVEPDSGETYFNGSPLTQAERSLFGYMPEERGLYPKQKILDQLIYFGELHRMSHADAKARATMLLDSFNLGDRLSAKLEELSLGNQQRVQVAAALLHRPIALLLDEPFSGLDPTAVNAMSGILKQSAAEGIPILFSSHQLDLIERLCDSLVILDRGKVMLAGKSEDLQNNAGVKYKIVSAPDAGWIRSIDGVEVLDIDGPTALIICEDEALRERIVQEAVERGTLREFSPIRPSLNEIYQEITQL